MERSSRVRVQRRFVSADVFDPRKFEVSFPPKVRHLQNRNAVLVKENSKSVYFVGGFEPPMNEKYGHKSNWIISPRIGVKIQKIVETTTQVFNLLAGEKN